MRNLRSKRNIRLPFCEEVSFTQFKIAVMSTAPEVGSDVAGGVTGMAAERVIGIDKRLATCKAYETCKHAIIDFLCAFWSVVNVHMAEAAAQQPSRRLLLVHLNVASRFKFKTGTSHHQARIKIQIRQTC